MANRASNNAGCLIGIIGLLAAVGMCTDKTVTSPTPTPSSLSSVSPTIWIGGKAANCRNDGRVTAPVAQLLSPNTPVTQIESRDGWTKVEAAGASCWVSAALTTADAPRSRAMGLTGTAVTAAGVGAAYGTQVHSAKKRRLRALSRSHSTTRARRSYDRGGGSYDSSGCPCSGGQVCIGPRGGRYCITSGGNKRYGV